MYISNLIAIVSTLAGGFTTDMTTYLTFHFINSASSPINWMANSPYSLEFFSPRYRRIGIAFKDIPIQLYFFTVIAHFTRDWFSLHLAVGIFCCVALPFWFVLPESPRWLAGNGRLDEAEKVLLRIGEVNGRELSKEQKFEISEILADVDLSMDKEVLNPLNMFSRAYLRRTLILSLSWIMISIGFYSLTYSATALHGDIILNFLYATMADTPVFLCIFLLVDRVGRPKTMAISTFVLGASCIVLALIPKSYTNVVLIFYLLGPYFLTYKASMYAHVNRLILKNSF